MKTKSLSIVLLGAALAAGSFAGLTRADDPTPTPKPTTPAPAPTPAPATTDRPRRSPADMLKNFRDQFEGLNLTDDQMKKIDGFVETAETEVKKVGDSEDRDARRTAFQAIGKLNQDVDSVLTDTQKAALNKKRSAMFVQRMKEPYANPELKLTDDQKTKIDGVFADMEKELAALPAPTPNDRDSFRKRGEVMRGAREKANALLTPDQQKLIPAQRFGRNRATTTTTPPPNN